MPRTRDFLLAYAVTGGKGGSDIDVTQTMTTVVYSNSVTVCLRPPPDRNLLGQRDLNAALSATTCSIVVF